MKILLGGVPLGCDNIGDEAIISCVVGLLREICPQAELTVSTRDTENTAHLLGVDAVPLYGFLPRPDWKKFAEVVRNFDVYIWFGATGLSDYPEFGVRLLEIAQRAKVRTIVWGVGMNSQLNPAFYRASGRKRQLLGAFSHLTGNRVDFIKLYENLLGQKTRRHIGRALKKCELVVLRDEESVREVARCGYNSAVLGADTAIRLPASAQLPLADAPNLRRVGFCISAQNAVRDRESVRQLWEKLLLLPDVQIVLIPMNPVTDRKLMLELASGTEPPNRIVCLDRVLPADVQAAASQCRVVVSSRLHLLILSANVGVPGLGLERGSKISNFLRNFHRKASGSVDDFDAQALYNEILAILNDDPAAIRKDMAQIMDKLHRRLDAAARQLRCVLAEK